MARSKLAKALASNNGGVAKYVNATEHTAMDEEQILQTALENKTLQDNDGANGLARSNVRHSLLRQAGFDFVDCRELIPNDKNSYAIDEGSIESLADLIYESKDTTPLIVRAVPEGLQIIDGERRYRAHMLLGEKYGERWYMVPARVFNIGTLSDEDAEFMLHAENVGQRNMTADERARGIAAVSDRIIARRRTDPKYQGRPTKEILAEQFGISPRQAVIEVNIGHNLVEEGMQLLGDGRITKAAADAIAKLPDEEQREIIASVTNGTIEKADVEKVAKHQDRRSVRQPKETDDYLKSARRALKHAAEMGEDGDRTLIAEIRNLLDKIDPDR